MHSSFRNLIQILQRELELHRRLNTLLEAERQAMTRVEADRLLALANEKDCIALQLKALEESRRLSVESIAESAGLSEPESLRLSDLASHAPEAEADELIRIAGQLRETVESSRFENEKNRFLANHSLRVVRDAVKALSQAPDTKKTYRAGGALRAYGAGPQVVTRRA